MSMIQLILVILLFLLFIGVAIFNILTEREFKRKDKIEEIHDKVKSGLDE